MTGGNNTKIYLYSKNVIRLSILVVVETVQMVFDVFLDC